MRKLIVSTFMTLDGLKLVASRVSSTGVVIGTYEPAGEIATGSFALD